MIEISFQYKPLFKLGVLHNYYSEQPSNDFRLVATPETLKLGKKLDLVLKGTGAENILLYEPSKLEGLHSEVEKNPVKFTFLLYTTNSCFINFTELPVEGASQLYYFSNNVVKKADATLLLHASNHVTSQERVPVKSEVQVTAGEKEKLVELKDDHGDVVYRKKLAAGERVAISNSQVPIGKYSLSENGKEQDTFVLFTNMPAHRPVAIIDISLTGAIRDEVLTGIEDMDIPFYEYRISYSARSTFWKYFLIGKYNSSLKNTIIDSGEKDLKFTGPQLVTMKNGQEAVMFVSEKPLPLKQIQDYKFQLKSVRSGLSNGKVIMDRLPLPSADMIKPESRDENSKIFSEIIVYI